MTYFKVIRDGAAVDAGSLWLQWNARHRCLMACEARDAHWAQSYDGATVYRFAWLNPLPEDAPTYPVAEAAIIDAQEYDDLIAVLPEGETVLEPVDPEPEPEPTPDPEPDEGDADRPMTVAEMRAAIASLTSMNAKENIAKGAFFVLHDTVYQATRAIVKGTEVKPGYNCVQKSLGDLS